MQVSRRDERDFKIAIIPRAALTLRHVRIVDRLAADARFKRGESRACRRLVPKKTQ